MSTMFHCKAKPTLVWSLLFIFYFIHRMKFYFRFLMFNVFISLWNQLSGQVQILKIWKEWLVTSTSILLENHADIIIQSWSFSQFCWPFRWKMFNFFNVTAGLYPGELYSWIVYFHCNSKFLCLQILQPFLSGLSCPSDMKTVHVNDQGDPS